MATNHNLSDKMEFIAKFRDLDALLSDSSWLKKHIEITVNMNFHEIEILNIFAPSFVAAVDCRTARVICRILKCINRDGVYYAFSKVMSSCASIIGSREVPGENKAFFWNLLIRDVGRSHTLSDTPFHKAVCMDSEHARHQMLTSRCFHKPDEADVLKYNFMKRTFSGTELDSLPDKNLLAAAKEDRVSAFEIQRQLIGKRISVSLLRFLLENGAVKCFINLLANDSARVYRCRSASEWLFIVCRHFPAQTAVPIIQLIEQQNPGIAAAARDPWGNTLLWNTLANDHDTDEVQKLLIKLGCDPDSMNSWGLSFRLVNENTI